MIRSSSLWIALAALALTALGTFAAINFASHVTSFYNAGAEKWWRPLAIVTGASAVAMIAVGLRTRRLSRRRARGPGLPGSDQR
jgi:hypothetical protein